MSRAYHSASSIKTGERCPRLWAYQYIDGLRTPEVPWADIEAGRKVEPRVRSLSLGKAVHAVGERYFDPTRGEPAWAGLPGQIFASGVHLLPRPKDCARIEVEAPIGREPCAEAPAGVVLRVHGVAWAGFRDLRVDTRDGGVLQVDYKTSSNIAEWALTPEALLADVQCALYTIDLCDRLGLREVASRWLYLETKRVRRALPVDVVMSATHAWQIVAPAAALARELDKLASSAEAEQRTDACAAYGGCPMHRSVGGPCDAQRSLRAHYEQHKGDHMALDPALAAKFGALAPPPPPAAPVAPPPPAAPAAPPAFGAGFAAPAAAAPPPPAAPAAPAFGAPPAAEPAKRTRKPKAEPAPAAPAEAPPAAPAAPPPEPAPATPGSLSARLADAVEQLAYAEHDVATAKARIAEILAGG